VNEDLTRSDGVVRCRRVTELEALDITWRAARALKIILEGIGIAF
jgi:hypothetical protein